MGARIASVCSFLAALVLLFAVPPAGATIITANAVANPGFEDGLAFWDVSGGSATYEADTTTAAVGGGSAKGTEPFRGSLGRLFQDVTALLIPGEAYVLSGWIRTEDVSTDGGGVVIGLDYVNDLGITPADGFVKEVGQVEATADWSFFTSGSFVLPPMPADTSALWVLTDFNDATGMAWFDEISLVGPIRVREVPTPPTSLLVLLAPALLWRFRRGRP